MNNYYDQVDFSECNFIEERMKYYTFYDFCDNCYFIKKLFNYLSPNGRVFYKYYVYANIHMDLCYKNYIWDYLNSFMGEKELFCHKQFYKAK